MSKIALLTAVALILFVVEAQIPAPIPVPGVKLGLANVVTLFAIFSIGRKKAVIVLLLRIVLGSLITGQVAAMGFSLAGGALCYIVMCVVRRFVTERQIWVVSVFGAIGHNLGQLAVAAFVVGTASVFLYLPILLVSGILTGLFTGLSAQYLYKHLKKLNIM
ncbi:MAG: Gx transporter family protein [Clostridiales bacterium]|nr:Gx transporter family protein [Clostridiales bacterium]